MGRQKRDRALFAPRCINAVGVEVHDRPAKCQGFREIALVRRNVVTVYIDTQEDIEAGLLEAQRHAAGSAKKVYCNWPLAPHSTSFGHV